MVRKSWPKGWVQCVENRNQLQSHLEVLVVAGKSREDRALGPIKATWKLAQLSGKSPKQELISIFLKLYWFCMLQKGNLSLLNQYAKFNLFTSQMATECSNFTSHVQIFTSILLSPFIFYCLVYLKLFVVNICRYIYGFNSQEDFT